jgi:hypothetical protein
MRQNIEKTFQRIGMIIYLLSLKTSESSYTVSSNTKTEAKADFPGKPLVELTTSPLDSANRLSSRSDSLTDASIRKEESSESSFTVNLDTERNTEVNSSLGNSSISLSQSSIPSSSHSSSRSDLKIEKPLAQPLTNSNSNSNLGSGSVSSAATASNSTVELSSPSISPQGGGAPPYCYDDLEVTNFSMTWDS